MKTTTTNKLKPSSANIMKYTCMYPYIHTYMHGKCYVNCLLPCVNDEKGSKGWDVLEFLNYAHMHTHEL